MNSKTVHSEFSRSAPKSGDLGVNHLMHTIYLKNKIPICLSSFNSGDSPQAIVHCPIYPLVSENYESMVHKIKSFQFNLVEESEDLITYSPNIEDIEIAINEEILEIKSIEFLVTKFEEIGSEVIICCESREQFDKFFNYINIQYDEQYPPNG